MQKGINTSFLDTSINPAEDFYSFVNGGWMEATEIPADRSSWGSFHELAKNTDQKILNILDDELSTRGPAENIAARLFESGMDIGLIQKSKLQAIHELLEEITLIADHKELPALIGKLLKTDLGGLIQFSVHPDLGNSQIYAAYLEPASLGLPEREYYLEENEKTHSIRLKYKTYIANLLEANSEKSIVHDPVEKISNRIFDFEYALAENIMPKEDRRDIGKLYNPMNYAALKERYSYWNWEAFFNAAEISPPDQIIVTDVNYFEFLNSFIPGSDLNTIKDHLSFLLIHQASPFAHQSLEEEHFEMYGRTIEGIQTMRPRKERILKVINSLLGEALGELFVSKYFPASAKQSALEMTADIIAAYKNRIKDLDWMGEATRKYALEKLDAVTIKIGYPEVWKAYSDLEIKSTSAGVSYLANIMASASWKRKKDVDRIAKEVDRNEWFMAPQIVNAYYNPMFNEIVFPAAILQPPFFDWEADAAVNYGGIGAVIGHEITHGFDDQGSRFDKQGNYNEWWTDEDRKNFQAKTQKLIEQFDAYYPFEDLSLNGTFTLGENIADLGGLSVAFDALQLYYSRHGRPGKIDGFSPEQRFFMSWATVWRTKIRQESLRNQIKTDPHPPGRYRAVAAPSNMDIFYAAFGDLSSGPWYRKKEARIKIW
jgi:putative endopeptidase